MKLSIVIKAAIIIIFLTSCGALNNKMNSSVNFPAFSYEGHRGARGLYPENAIGAMKTAIDLPMVTTLEMDCHITKDKKVVVYHDHFINSKFVQYMDGKQLKTKDNNATLYKYTWNELQKFDIGSKFRSDFPDQKKVKTQIPLLSSLIDETESYAKAKRSSPMFYNIETKSTEGKDHEYHPSPQEFSDLVLEVVIEKGIGPRTVIQSFDKRTIQYIHKTYPQIKVSYLIDQNNTKTIEELVNELGFKPFIISPNHKLVTKKYVKSAHKLGIKIIPWTVNSHDDILALKALKVDGIISDYPNLF